MKISNAKLQALMDTVDKKMNPFDPNIDTEQLYNIHAGKSASPEINRITAQSFYS